MFIIPIKDLPSFTEEVTFENTPYILEFNWNSRGAYWTIDFYDRDSAPLVIAIKITLNYELISRFVDRGLPKGFLFALDPSNNFTKIQKNDFRDGRVFLTYMTEEEVATL